MKGNEQYQGHSLKSVCVICALMFTRPKIAILARRLYVDHIFRPVFSDFPAHAPFFCLVGIRATRYGRHLLRLRLHDND